MLVEMDRHEYIAFKKFVAQQKINESRGARLKDRTDDRFTAGEMGNTYRNLKQRKDSIITGIETVSDFFSALFDYIEKGVHLNDEDPINNKDFGLYSMYCDERKNDMILGFRFKVITDEKIDTMTIRDALDVAGNVKDKIRSELAWALDRVFNDVDTAAEDYIFEFINGVKKIDLSVDYKGSRDYSTEHEISIFIHYDCKKDPFEIDNPKDFYLYANPAVKTFNKVMNIYSMKLNKMVNSAVKRFIEENE